MASVTRQGALRRPTGESKSLSRKTGRAMDIGGVTDRNRVVSRSRGVVEDKMGPDLSIARYSINVSVPTSEVEDRCFFEELRLCTVPSANRITGGAPGLLNIRGLRLGCSSSRRCDWSESPSPLRAADGPAAPGTPLDIQVQRLPVRNNNNGF